MSKVESTEPALAGVAKAAAGAAATGRYLPRHKIRLVTATALFDGHDASINIMRRIAQGAGAEVIHLGHNRSAEAIVIAAIQEDAQAIAVTSYQGGHLEFFKFMHDLLAERGCGHVRIFGGGGGVILPAEIEELQTYGIERIYSPDDGRSMGLVGMIEDMLRRCDFAPPPARSLTALRADDHHALASALTLAETDPANVRAALTAAPTKTAPVLGITGTGGSGKSSLIDEIVRRFLYACHDRTIAVLSVDPSRRKTGGALLGDRIRMNAIDSPRAFMRSMATRQANLALAGCIPEAIAILRHAGFDLIVLETSGIGQSDTEIVDFADVSLYVMTPEFGAPTQLEKIDMLDYADVVAINKFDRRGAEDALRDVRKQWARNRNAFDVPAAQAPVFGTMASRFGDPGTNRLFSALLATLEAKVPGRFQVTRELPAFGDDRVHIIPPSRARYLAEIADDNRRYARWVEEQIAAARLLQNLDGATAALHESNADPVALAALAKVRAEASERLDRDCQRALDGWQDLVASYASPEHVFAVREQEVRVRQRHTSLSGTDLPKVALPRFTDAGERLRWLLTENVPGRFPFAAGVFPFKREGEDPTRMFAGEGGAEATNKRFHYLAAGQPAQRLSTAFDSVTLYGEDPHLRPDIYGKVGNSGVSVSCLDDAKRLYSGFDLTDPKTSVSMTINGPAPMLLAFFLNAAIDQQCEVWLRNSGFTSRAEKVLKARYDDRGLPRPRYRGALPPGNDGLGLLLLGVTGDEVVPPEVYAKIAAATVKIVRGTVQADILKEDQAQNTCIFSTEFALRMMGDVQSWFIENGVRNFYSVSISGYHIAEAGANPITQLALTLANGFTYVEYYRARGMAIDDFAPNLSFFFSNGLDPEYAVIGRVARRVWAKAIRNLYGGNERSQKLKYHIQTSGRSLHAQEIAFNDIRTTLQALYAIYDNCNSLHTNAYDEAITTPTEESVRRAMAIQLIINRELGQAKNENPLQGAFLIEELSDLVEEAVMVEFERLAERGGVLGAMETMYQRAKIQEESLFYESQKSKGELPIVGVNTFIGRDGSPFVTPQEVRRSSDDEKRAQIATVEALWQAQGERATERLRELQDVAMRGGNVFAALMACAKVCSLGQMSTALYHVGGQYRRNM